MKTSICSEALSHFEAEKIAFPPKSDGHTDGRTEDICNYSVASLPKILFNSLRPYVLLKGELQISWQLS